MGFSITHYTSNAAMTARAKELLSDRKTGFVIVLLIILSRAFHLIYFFNTRNDMTYQVLGAQNFLDGHGISNAVIASTDLSHIIYQPIQQWPPGFSVLFIPFYLLLGKNYIIAAIALSIVCAILLIIVARAILRLLEVPAYLINIFTILSGFFGYYFYNKPCTDAVGITFFVISIYYALLVIKKGRADIKNILALSISLIITGFIKYLFIPVIIIVPLFLIAKGVAEKIKSLKKIGLTVFLILLAIFGSYLLYQKSISGAVGYIKEPERGFFPENLANTFPFITGSFIKPDSIEQISSLSSSQNSFLFKGFQLATILVFALFLFYFLKDLIQTRLKNRNIRQDFFNLSFSLSISIIIILIFLSLTVAKEPLDFGQTWTYVEEPRYYGLTNVLLHIGVFALYPAYQLSKKPVVKILLPILILLMAPEMIRGLVFTTNRIVHINKEKYGWQYELQFQKKVDQIVHDISEREKNRTIILTGTSDWFTLRASLYIHKPVFTDTYKLLNIQELKTTKSVTVLVIIREDHMNDFQSFISSKNVRSEGNGYGFFFYSFDLNP